MQVTLSERLRMAALARAERGGRVVDTFVIDEEGVIDLTALEDRGPDSRASDPAPLGETAGRYGEAGDVSSLFVDDGGRRRRFRRGEGEPAVAPVRMSADVPQFTSALAGRIQAENAVPAEAPVQAENAVPAEAPVQAENAAPAEAPVQADGPVAAGDRTGTFGSPVPEQPADPHVGDPPREPTPEAHEIELDSFDGIEIDLRTQGRPSSLQSAIEDFNQSSPIHVPEVNIDSGIRYAESGTLSSDGVQAVPDLTTRPGNPSLDDTQPSDRVQPDQQAGPGDTEDGVTETPELADEGVACPMCGRPASLDFENRFLGINFYSCRDCFHMWHLAAENDS